LTGTLIIEPPRGNPFSFVEGGHAAHTTARPQDTPRGGPADNAVAAIQRERNGDGGEIVDGESTLKWFGTVGIS